MSRRRGFTLFELLIVLAILFVLFAVLYPVFIRPQPQRHWICASNEKQFGLAIIQYSEDNNELFPSGSQGGGVGWGGQIFPYVKSSGVYRCPDDLTKSAPQRSVASYGLNRNIALHPSVKNDNDPAQTVLLFEVAGVAADVTRLDEEKSQGATAFSAAGDGTDGSLAAGHTPQAAYAAGNIGGRAARQPSQLSEGRHQGGANYLFVDGHVHFLLPAQVSSGGNATSAGAGQMGTVSGHAAGTGNTAYMATFSMK